MKIFSLKPTSRISKISIYRFILCLYAVWIFPDLGYLLSDKYEPLSWSPVGVFQVFETPLNEATLISIYCLWWISLFTYGSGLANLISSKIFFFTSLFLFGYVYNFTEISHGWHVFVMVLGILAFTQQDSQAERFWILNPLPQETGIFLIKLYIVYVWTLVGYQKLYFSGWDWVFSDNFVNTVFLTPVRTPFSDLLLRTNPDFFQFFALCGLLIEVASPLALVSKRGALVFPFLWTLFHILVSAILGGHQNFFRKFPHT